MSFNPEMLRSRLAGSTEAADSITSTAHWILFHKRHAATVAEQWAEAVSSDKNKLPQIYIANEVIQQSKIKRKNEFVDSFSKILPDALAKAYVQSDLPTRDRITRVVRVWRDRAIFTPQAQLEIEKSIKSAGESLASSVPAELVILVKRFADLTAAANTPNGVSSDLAKSVKAELDSLYATVDEIASRKTEIVHPEVEPLPSQANTESKQQPDAQPEAEVYTAQNAKESVDKIKSSTNAEADENDDDGEIGYASDSDEEKQNHTESSAPPEKKQKVGVDPQLASFLASISNNS